MSSQTVTYSRNDPDAPAGAWEVAKSLRTTRSGLDEFLEDLEADMARGSDGRTPPADLDGLRPTFDASLARVVALAALPAPLTTGQVRGAADDMAVLLVARNVARDEKYHNGLGAWLDTLDRTLTASGAQPLARETFLTWMNIYVDRPQSLPHFSELQGPLAERRRRVRAWMPGDCTTSPLTARPCGGRAIRSTVSHLRRWRSDHPGRRWPRSW